VGAAIAFWVLMFVLLAILHDHSGRGFISIGFFLVLFTTLSVFYNSTAVEVTRDSVILRGVASIRLVPFEDILKVDVVPGMLQTTYSIFARRGFLSFTSLIADHQRLMELIVERARLAPA
jgi:hypothetical protein